MEIALVNNIKSNTVTVNQKLLTLTNIDNRSKIVSIATTVTTFEALSIQSEINIKNILPPNVYIIS